MKRKKIKKAVFWILLAGILFSCKQDFDGFSNSRNFTIEEAQTWYENHKPEYLVLKSGNGDNYEKVVIPNWKTAKKEENSMLEVVTVNLLTNRGFGYAFNDARKAYDDSNEMGYLTSMTQLIIVKNKKAGQTESFLMTMIASKSYLDKKNFKFWKVNGYLHWDKEFDGVVLYHGLDGSFINGWRFTEGKITNIVRLPENENIEIHLKSGSYDCYNETFIEWNLVELYSAYAGVGETLEYKGTKYDLVMTTQSVTYCFWNENELPYISPYYTYGGTTSGSSLPGNYSPQTGDVFVKQNLSNSMTTQVLNTCFTSIMEFINQEMCGGTHDLNYYNNDYHELTGNWVPFSGVVSSDVGLFLSRHFGLELIDNYAVSIRAGRIIMTDILTPVDTVHHAVAVVGYHTNGTLIYMDPETGNLQEATSSYFGASFEFAISYCK